MAAVSERKVVRADPPVFGMRKVQLNPQRCGDVVERDGQLWKIEAVWEVEKVFLELAPLEPRSDLGQT